MGIKVIVSMDWEGTSLEERNLNAIVDFKRQWNVPVVHFHNPAYYTHPDWSASQVSKFLGQAISSDDEVGLHLHTPQHLLRKAGVEPRFSPCFSRYGDYNAGSMNGQEVMLLAYQKEEVKALIQYGLSVFQQHGFSQVSSFRAGGWMADERVWETLIELGLPIESSAANAQFLKGSSWEGDNLERYSELLWGERGSAARPFYLETFCGRLFEIPNNLGAIDYWNNFNIYQILEQVLVKADPLKEFSNEPVLVINSHQETAADHLPKLKEFLIYLRSLYGNALEFVTNRDVYFSELQKTQALENQYA